jgi:hypothetical protein
MVFDWQIVTGETGTDLFFETGGRLHTAIREDASMNLAAIGDKLL